MSESVKLDELGETSEFVTVDELNINGEVGNTASDVEEIEDDKDLISVKFFDTFLINSFT